MMPIHTHSTRAQFGAHVRTSIGAFTAAALVLGCLAAAPAMADEKAQPRTISITAEGTVESTPDLVEITAGVISEGKRAKEALAENTERMTKVVAAMKENGVDPKDLQTSTFSVQPVYQTDHKPEEGRTSRTLVGYEVVNQVHLTVREVGKLGTILDKLVSLGANKIDDISFGLDDPAQQENEARKNAMKAAIAKAKLYARAAGARLGKVITISENDYSPMPKRSTMRMEAAMSAPAPIEGGTTTTSIQLNVTWELK
ncbi:26 kDa periplasmic immunogenic protein precursor [Methyloligella halotolerans]|uniref:26 kDa periplasmic immunogenic protein n=1 Tax=Methyloligella halotolerans TaxID=1177755 RepID=A0A1E2RX18_9HYPH|nr:SIMPL domain-containing protein [Methyloligella halotolerans]ODA66599.1 26 kDa periplasmic immunogenic protein precursor [Methyloligella halotolerans]